MCLCAHTLTCYRLRGTLPFQFAFNTVLQQGVTWSQRMLVETKGNEQTGGEHDKSIEHKDHLQNQKF